ncbi:MAG: polysaccharide biosynthesis tyrosine autokinase [Tildeniella nuda ZEHNDER 1965/U140]|nr:polysaccharide biosynthesis tyrosine autokinase [Tildeniella nuda ZEHNDER 1965/U140]
MTVGNLVHTAETDPGYGQLVEALFRRRFWLLGISLSVLVAVTIYTLLKKPIYQSSMQLLVESNYQSKKDAGAGSENQFADSNVEVDYSTQLTQMRSSQLLQKAVVLLQAEYPKLEAAELQKALILTQVEEDKVKTKIFQAVYTSDDPEKTQKVLMAIQQVYKDYNREQQTLRLTRGLAFVNEQLPLVEKQVDRAEDAMERFRKSQNLVDPEVQSRALIDALSNLQKEQQSNQAQMREVQGRYQTLQQQLALSPQQALIAARLSQSSRYQSLLNEIQKSELAIAQQRLRFKAASPYVQQALDQRQRQRDLLATEVRRILGSNAAQVDIQGDSGLSVGQLSATDLTLASSLVDAQVNLVALQGRAQSLNEAERSLQQQLRRFPSLLAEYGRLQPNVQIGRNTLQQLLKARQDIALEIARGGFDWQVVEEPKLGKQIGPNLKQNILLGAVAGLMLGSVAAFIRDTMDDAVHTPDDLKQVALPLLGMVPALSYEEGLAALVPFREAGAPAPPMMQVVHWQPFRESLDLIYKNIQLLPSAAGLRSLVVTSALAGEGKSTIALGLAISAARLHQRVLLVDADLRRPSLHQQLDLPNDYGLSTLLTRQTPFRSHGDLQPLHHYTDIPLSILTSGPMPADPAQLLSAERMGDLMQALEQAYDLIIIDAPPVLGIVDALLTASFCSSMVLVGRIGHVTRAELVQATALLSKLNVIGVIANGSDLTANRYFSYERKYERKGQLATL